MLRCLHLFNGFSTFTPNVLRKVFWHGDLVSFNREERTVKSKSDCGNDPPESSCADFFSEKRPAASRRQSCQLTLTTTLQHSSRKSVHEQTGMGETATSFQSRELDLRVTSEKLTAQSLESEQ
jgi:hypothetical protein